ncbi:MAG: hypothetical protein AAF962_12120 [Actinomycetota bacterium]
MSDGSGASALQRALTAFTEREVALSALVGVTLPSLAVLAFWLLAAGRFGSEGFAPAFALVAVIGAIGRVAHLGMARGLERRLPEGATGAGPVVLRAAALAGATAAMLALLLVFVLDLWAPDLLDLQLSDPLAAFVVAAAVAWALYLLAEALLAALFEEQDWVWIMRAAVAVLRVVLLLALSAVSDGGGDDRIVVAWALPVLIAVGVVVFFVVRPMVVDALVVPMPTLANPASPPPFSLQRLRLLGRTAWLRALTPAVAVAAVAVIAVGRFEAAEATHYHLAWLLTSAGLLFTSALVTAVTGPRVEGERIDDRSLTATLVVNTGLGLAVYGLLLGVGQLMAALPGTAFEGIAGPMALLTVLVVPWAVATTFTVRLEAEGHTTEVLIARALGVAVVVVLGAVLSGPWGFDGLAAAWLVVAAAAAAVAVDALTLWWWAPKLSGGLATLGARVASAFQGTRGLLLRRGLNRQVDQHLGAMYQTMPGWRRETTTELRQTLAVVGHDGRPPLRVELARNDEGGAELRRRRTAVADLNGMTGLGGLRNLVPYPIDHGEHLGRSYLVESVVSGERGDASANAALQGQRIDALAAALGDLHTQTATEIAMDESSLESWVTRPLRRLGDGIRLPEVDLARVASRLVDGLSGKTLPGARIHGSLRLDQARFEQGGPRLTGLINWEWSEDGPIALDWGVLALSALRLEQGRDIGPVVSELLDAPATLTNHRAFASPAGGDVSPTALVLLAWLQYLRPHVAGSGGATLSRYWEARNVVPVIRRLAAATR